MPNQKPKQPSLPLVVAIDGPSKSGKGTVSLELARHYGFFHLDTGAMYRLLTWHCLLTGVDIGKPEAVLNACLSWKTELVAIDHEIRLTLDASNDPGRIHAPNVDVCILYGDGNWSDCWLKLWTQLDLFPVVSPTLIHNRPIRTIRDLGDHTILHADDGREWHTWLAAADARDLLRGRNQHRMGDARLALEAAVHGHGVLHGRFHKFLRRIGGDGDGASAVTGEFAAIDILAGHFFLPASAARTRTGRVRVKASGSRSEPP